MQTGAGKTYSTIGGSAPEERGICPRSLEHIYRHISSHNNDNANANASNVNVSYKIQCSAMEIYKDQIYDLLALGKQQHKKQKSSSLRRLSEITTTNHKNGDSNSTTSQHVKGLMQQDCPTIQLALQCLQRAQNNRVTAEHLLNESSSRSHFIFTIYINKTISSPSSFSDTDTDTDTHTHTILTEAGTQSQTITSKLNIVDLAGSERHRKTQTTGHRQQEASFVNQSLTFLQQVVPALQRDGTNNHNNGYIPYRQSKLTHWLKNSFSNTNHTLVFIGCIWASHLDQTLGTLKFAKSISKLEHTSRSNLDKEKENVVESNNGPSVGVLFQKVQTVEKEIAIMKESNVSHMNDKSSSLKESKETTHPSILNNNNKEQVNMNDIRVSIDKFLLDKDNEEMKHWNVSSLLVIIMELKQMILAMILYFGSNIQSFLPRYRNEQSMGIQIVPSSKCENEGQVEEPSTDVTDLDPKSKTEDNDSENKIYIENQENNQKIHSFHNENSPNDDSFANNHAFSSQYSCSPQRSKRKSSSSPPTKITRLNSPSSHTNTNTNTNIPKNNIHFAPLEFLFPSVTVKERTKQNVEIFKQCKEEIKNKQERVKQMIHEINYIMDQMDDIAREKKHEQEQEEGQQQRQGQKHQNPGEGSQYSSSFCSPSTLSVKRKVLDIELKEYKRKYKEKCKVLEQTKKDILSLQRRQDEYKQYLYNEFDACMSPDYAG